MARGRTKSKILEDMDNVPKAERHLSLPNLKKFRANMNKKETEDEMNQRLKAEIDWRWANTRNFH